MKPSNQVATNNIIRFKQARAPLVAPLTAVATATATARTQRKLNSEQLQANPEGILIQLEREMLAAIKERNVPTLSRLLAKDFVYRSPYTKDLAKDEFLDDVRNSRCEIGKIWFSEMKVSLHGKMAVIHGVQKAHLIEGREAVLHQTAFSDVFIQRQGAWLLASSYGYEIDPEKVN